MCVVNVTIDVAGLGDELLARISELEERLVALNDQQEAALLAAVDGVVTEVREAADRVAALIEAQNIDDPEVTAAIGDLRDVADRAENIAPATAAPGPGTEPTTPGGEPTTPDVPTT